MQLHKVIFAIIFACSLHSLTFGSAQAQKKPAPFTQVAVIPYFYDKQGNTWMLVKQNSSTEKYHVLAGRKAAHHTTPFETKDAILKHAVSGQLQEKRADKARSYRTTSAWKSDASGEVINFYVKVDYAAIKSDDSNWKYHWMTLDMLLLEFEKLGADIIAAENNKLFAEIMEVGRKSAKN